MSFIKVQDKSLQVTINHESLKKLAEPKAYVNFDMIHKENRLKNVVIDFSEINYMSPQESEVLSRFIKVLRILNLQLKALSISPLLSISLASREDIFSELSLWKR